MGQVRSNCAGSSLGVPSLELGLVTLDVGLKLGAGGENRLADVLDGAHIVTDEVVDE